MSILFSSLRGAIQTWWGFFASWVASTTGVVITEDQSMVITGVTVSVITGLTIAMIRWAESLKGDAWWQRGARFLAKLAMIGLSGHQPTYPEQPRA